MRTLFSRLRARSAARLLAATTFTEECGACTPSCRHDALRESIRDLAERASLYRY